MDTRFLARYKSALSAGIVHRWLNEDFGGTAQMKIIASILMINLGAVLALRSGYLPWSLVSKAELSQQADQLRELEGQLRVRQNPVSHSGAWMWDPAYRTALERTTIIGRPEFSRPRD